MMWNVNQELLFLLVFHIVLAVCQRKPQKALEQVNGCAPSCHQEDTLEYRARAGGAGASKAAREGKGKRGPIQETSHKKMGQDVTSGWMRGKRQGEGSQQLIMKLTQDKVNRVGSFVPR